VTSPAFVERWRSGEQGGIEADQVMSFFEASDVGIHAGQGDFIEIPCFEQS
jgi:hypothetical protein